MDTMRPRHQNNKKTVPNLDSENSSGREECTTLAAATERRTEVLAGAEATEPTTTSEHANQVKVPA